MDARKQRVNLAARKRVCEWIFLDAKESACFDARKRAFEFLK